LTTALGKRLDAGKAYHQRWQKYEQEQTQRSATPDTANEAESQPQIVTVKSDDPITGTWEIHLSLRGQRMQQLTAELKLEGTRVSGTIRSRGETRPVEEGSTWDPKAKVLVIKLTSPMGLLDLRCELVEPDRIEGELLVRGFKLGIEGERVAKENSAGLRRDANRPKLERQLEAYRELFAGKATALILAEAGDEIASALAALAPHAPSRIVVAGASDAVTQASALRAAGAGVILRPDRETATLALRLLERGVDVALGSFGIDRTPLLPLIAAELTRGGLPADAALRAVTWTPARLLGQADRLGAILPGCDADLVLWSAHPMAPAARVELVLTGGKVVYERKAANR
jgi:hypothetical protein